MHRPLGRQWTASPAVQMDCHVSDRSLLTGQSDESPQTGKYLGTFQVYSIKLPDPKVLERDESIGALIADFLAEKLGLQVANEFEGCV